MRQRPLRLLTATALLCAALPVLSAQASTPKVSDADRAQMTDYLVDMLPLHLIFERVLESSHAELEAELKPDQIACFRQNVSRTALAARKRKDVDVFADEAPEDFSASLKLLNQGAGMVMRQLGQYSVDASLAMSGEKTSPPDAATPGIDMSKMSADHMVAFTTFAYASPYQRLRDLSGYGDFNETSEDAPSPTDLMMDAMASDIARTCGIPPAFFE